MITNITEEHFTKMRMRRHISYIQEHLELLRHDLADINAEEGCEDILQMMEYCAKQLERWVG